QSCQPFVLYTHQKMKKSKTWQDGILRIRTGGNKAILFDDKGQCLESIFIKSQVYFFRSVFYFYGFQGPRQVEKKISTMEDGEKTTILPLSKHCQGTFPSSFYVTSPLFSTICKKDAETNLSADFHEDVCMDDDGEHMSLSSLLSVPFLGRCKEAERQNSDRSIVKPESPSVTGHAKSSSQTTDHGAASCNIRSTAQIIALLESKPTQGCRDQTSSKVTECLFRFQASENADSLYRQKPTILPAFSGNPAKRLIQNIQHLPFTKGTVNDKKEWNAEMLLNSAEQPHDKEVTRQRHDKKAYTLSQDLQDPYNTNSCFLPESTLSRMSDSQFVLSSGDVSCSVSPITFEKNLSRYREDSSVKLQSELQPRQNSERIPGDQELSVDVTLTKIGFVKEELSMHGKDCGPDEEVMEVNFNLMEAFDFNDTDNEDLCERDVNKLTEGDMLSQSPHCLKGEDVAQNAALRLHSFCEVVTHSKNEEVKCSTLDGENGGNHCTEGHQVKGSAASEIMLRAPCSQLGWQHYPDNMEFAAERFLSPVFSRKYIISDFRQVKHFFQKLISSLDPDSTISPASGSEETVRDIQEPLIHRILPSEPELSEIFFSKELQFIIALYNSFARKSLRTFEAQSSPVFPISAFGPEDRNYETSVFGEYMEDRERESIQPVFPNVTAQYRQSKWLKYQNSAQCDLITQNSDDGEVTDDICAEDILGMPLGDTGESSAVNKSAPGSAPLLTAKSMLGKCHANTSNQDLISERKLLSLHLSQIPLAEATQKVLSHLSCHTVTGDCQDITISELSFPNVDKVKYTNLAKRKVSIPTVFQSHVHYKQIFKAALTEQLNIMLFELSQRLHNALSKVDTSFHTSLKDGQSESKESCVPLCNHMHPAKLVTVKKEGQNKGRLFYTCDAPKAEQCSFFKWIEDVNPTQIKSRPSVVLHDIKSIGTYLRSQKISLFEGCQLLVRKTFEIQTQRCRKFKKMMNIPARFDGDSKTKLYLKLSRKEHYSLYSKDDIWVVSKTLNFDPLDTFIACSAFFGPSSNNEVELLPLKGYCPSNWRSNMFVQALLVCNASVTVSYTATFDHCVFLRNFDSKNATNRVNKIKFIPPAISLKRTMMYGPVSTEVAMGLAEKMIKTFSLNPDQATSLIQIAQMMTSCENIKPVEEHQNFPITIIRGVFGAGKSYLLSVVILFLVQLFESSEAVEGPRPAPWKLLIASSTNVAVDRILLGLLDLGFEDFIRVGSIRKITKAILPHSLHAGSGNENEQLKELLALMKEDLTPAEKIYVRKSIEQHKLGTNKTILQQVKVVGVTCAACPLPCLNTLKFPVVMLDECSQMTEPASLLPIARFQCEKLVLVGDPKQLPPTIQGSESVHEKGLEQTLFDRLCLMGHKPILLRTQYRCHPAISAIANELFYEGNLIDGVSEKDRSPLLDWLPTLCFYSVNGVEQIERDNSFYNMAEVHFTVKLIQSLIASGIEGSAIGVITLYKSQMCKVCNLLSGIHSEAFEIKAVQVSTVDAFQGAEKEIIVLSCVRTRQIGFIDSEKRMNVALTRAKRHLLIVGNLACLSRNRLWGRVIHHCKGWENGLQHVSQCEQQLNNILKCYLEKRKEKEQNMKKEK
uniref:5'-3' DNA helicase ZGRF1 n=1 Tax=Accipiter nisus TaxID=211598 RepID=A0A8B9RUV4_9AVES